MDSNFEFVGVGVMKDLMMLKNDYGLEYNKGIDVSLLAKKKWPDQISFGAQKCLTKELVYLDMEKSKAVCAREWKSKLTQFKLNMCALMLMFLLRPVKYP